MRRLFVDLLRVVILMGVSGAYLVLSDPANAVVFQSLAIAVFLVGGTHLTRRVLFHKIDLQLIALTAVKDNNGSAALVFLGICGVIVAVMFLSMKVIS